MKAKHQRLLTLLVGIVGLGIAVFLVSSAFRDNLVFFYTPSDLSHKKIHPEQRLRMGGLVEQNSLRQDGQTVSFAITDRKNILKVNYKGLLPDLFREGQGVVVEGHLSESGLFQAETVLAKHDENYMPKEVADKLKEKGLWQDDR
ncbi:MAG: cytochrome c maturation protein CcmE [Alphaproteobacteria bacterium]|nr:cytochrome c maturation protein CcmE [Alphaproteobacteria bacterium]